MADAISILPDEVWKIILSHVEQDPNDLLSCYQTCTLFQSILKQSRTSWMFPLLYPCLHNQLKWNLKDVMSCREICRSWNKGVDTYMESHYFQPISSPNPSWLRTKSLSGVPPSDDGLPVPGFGAVYPEGHCETFMADFKGSRRNPFVSRTLRLTSVNFPQALEFIKKFGCHVWTLFLDFAAFASIEEGITVTQLVKRLWDILEWVPSLKYLELGSLGAIHFLEESDEDVQTFFETHEPPHLLHLLFLEILGWRITPTTNYLQLRNIFIHYFQSPKVTILFNYDDSPWSWESPSRCYLILGWNMKSLAFTWNTASTYFRHQALALSQINCRLESLDVSVKCFPDIDQLLVYILKFKDTLRSLSLTMENHQYEDTWSSYFKYFSYINQLEKLERLEISFTNKTIFLLKTLMGNWAEGNRAGGGGRKISKLNGSSSEEYYEIGDFECYPLCREDIIRVFREVEMLHLRDDNLSVDDDNFDDDNL